MYSGGRTDTENEASDRCIVHKSSRRGQKSGENEGRTVDEMDYTGGGGKMEGGE